MGLGPPPAPSRFQQQAKIIFNYNEALGDIFVSWFALGWRSTSAVAVTAAEVLGRPSAAYHTQGMQAAAMQGHACPYDHMNHEQAVSFCRFKPSRELASLDTVPPPVPGEAKSPLPAAQVGSK